MLDLGFPNTYNENEDFYKYDGGKTSGPKSFDVIVTNPPYTADHIPNLIKFCHRQHKPFLLLLPNYCIHKYANAFTERFFDGDKYVNAPNYFYIWSEKRYLYKSPKGGREKGAVRKDRKTSPFVSFWYCSFGAAQSSRGYSESLHRFQAEFMEARQAAHKRVAASMKAGKQSPTQIVDRAIKEDKLFLKGHFCPSAGDLPRKVLDSGNQKRKAHGSGVKRGGKKRRAKKPGKGKKPRF